MTDSPRTTRSTIHPSGLSRRTALRRLSGVGAATAAAVMAPLPTAAEAAVSTANRHEALAHRLFAALNGGNLDDLDPFIAPDHIFHTCGQPEPIVGRTALKQLLVVARARDDDAPYTLESVVANGDQLAARWTRTWPAMDPETGRPEGTLTVDGQFICRIRNDQLIETWNVSFAQGAAG